MMTRYLFLLGFVLVSFGAIAQNNSVIKGTVKDEKGEALIGVGVLLYQNGNYTNRGATTDENGNYYIGALESGEYELEAKYLGYSNYKMTKIKLITNQILDLNIELREGNEIISVDIFARKIIEPGVTDRGKIFDEKDIKNAPIRDITSITGNTVGVSQTDEGRSMTSGGSRPNTNNVLIDNVKVNGSNLGLSEKEIAEMQVITGGVPVAFGDATGVITNITTKAPPAKFGGSVQMETSQFLDAFGTNRLDFGLSGPLIRKNKIGDDGKPHKTSVLGFRLSGTFYTSNDRLPSSLGSYKLKDEKTAEINDAPLMLHNGAIIPAGQLITEDDIEYTKVRPNNRDMNFQGNATLHYQINDNMSLRVGGQYYNEKERNAVESYRLFNSERNPVSQNSDWRVRAQFKHTIPSNEKSFVQNVNYYFQVDYSRSSRFTQDPIHKGKFFNYGYIGKFEEKLIPFFTYNDAGELVHTNFNRTLVSYTPNRDINPILANYNNLINGANLDISSYYNTNGNFNTAGTSIFDNLHDNAGVVYDLYSKSQANQTGIRTQANFDLVKPGSKSRHTIQVGLIFEQINNRRYNLNPVSLWALAKQNANFHLSESATDSDVLTGTTQVYNAVLGGLQNVNIYAPISTLESQTEFSKNLRASLGVGTAEWLNVFGMNPDQLELSMFSPTELIANNGILNYYGYDYLGNPSGRAGFDDFFTKRNEQGVYTRPVAPFSPVYSAVYVEDRFQYKDIILRAGLRLDRYDANTKVLRDPYSLYGAFTAGEIADSRYDYAKNNIPSTIGPNAMVYVSSAETPETATITAFRDGDIFYNSEGVVVNNPNVLGDKLIPARKDYTEAATIDKDNSSVPYSPSLAFRDFNPVLILMPRLSFSFPISDAAEFFAHYDVLSQKPIAGESLATPLDYYNFSNKANTDIFGNPNLRPTRTTDYEAGYQQKLTENSSLEFSFFYREFRNLVQVRRWQLAYPSSYESFANDDFSTSKGFTAEYESRRVKNIQISANYTLQFADGTGSGSSSNRGLTDVTGIFRDVFPLDYDQRHQLYVGLDYRYEDEEHYDGPVLFGKKIFQNAGAHLDVNVNSGTPYTRKAIATKFGGMDTEGSRNGARLPWNYRLDFKIDKSFCLTPKLINAKSGKKALYMNVYIRIQNLLNTQNVLGVYQASGSAADDGYLSDPNGNGPRYLQEKINEGFSNYETLYNLRMRTPDNYSLPRRIYFGASLEF